MSRQYYLDLAARGHRLPLAADLVLHDLPNPEAALLDGAQLGAVIGRAAEEFRTPLGILLMDLKVEKESLLRFFGEGEGADGFHFAEAPAADRRADFQRWLREADPTPRVAANLGAIRHVAQRPGVLPVGMSIGPFSLMTKLVSDPITPVFLAGSGIGAEEDPEVALVEACLELATAHVLDYVERQVAAGARAIFIAEPAANKVYLSPRQLETGPELREKFVLGPNRRIADLLAARGVDLLFHCCGELVHPLLDGFCSLRPAMLSLGSSRCLWEDAARVPKDIVLYGNLPSKQFYSDQLAADERVAALAAELVARMRTAGHPFILGTECDTLHVPGAGEAIRRKVRLMLAA